MNPVVPPVAPSAPAVPPVDPKAAIVPPVAPAALAAEPVKDTPRQAAEKLRLLRDRQEFDANRTKFADEQKALDAEKKALADEKSKLAGMQKLADAQGTKDPGKVLAAAGFSDDDIAKFLVSGGPKPVDPKIAELEAKIAALTESDTKRTAAARTAEEQAARDEAIASLAESKDTLPLVNALGQGEAVLAEMMAEHKKSGNMDLDAAAKAVEARLAATMPAYLDNLVKEPAMKALLEAALAKVKPATPAAAAPAAGEKVADKAALAGETPPEKKADEPPQKGKINWTSKSRPADVKITVQKRDETWNQFQARKAAERKAAGGAS